MVRPHRPLAAEGKVGCWRDAPSSPKKGDSLLVGFGALGEAGGGDNWCASSSTRLRRAMHPTPSTDSPLPARPTHPAPPTPRPGEGAGVREDFGTPPPLPARAIARRWRLVRWERRGGWEQLVCFVIDPSASGNASNASDRLPSPGPANTPRPANASAGRGGGGEGGRRPHRPLAVGGKVGYPGTPPPLPGMALVCPCCPLRWERRGAVTNGAFRHRHSITHQPSQSPSTDSPLPVRPITPTRQCPGWERGRG